MSEREEPEKKRRKSNTDRTSEYRKANPEQAKLSKEKVKLETLKRRLEDDKFDEEYKKKERDRKKAYEAVQDLTPIWVP